VSLLSKKDPRLAQGIDFFPEAEPSFCNNCQSSSCSRYREEVPPGGRWAVTKTKGKKERESLREGLTR